MADADPQPSSRIFISYRREDSSGHVLALLPALRKQFGADRIFKDTDNIPPGSDFVKFIRRELESCSVMLAIIGRDWLNVQDPRQKRRRLDNPDDFLRVEVSTALKNERIRVIPVLVDRGTVPAAEELPPDLVDLSYRNAVELSDGRWDSDVQLLIQAIERATAAATPAPPKAPERPDLADLQRRRARDIAAHVAAATEAFETRDYEGTIWACEKALLIDPQHIEALQLLDRARKAIDEQKIDQWLKEARQAMQQGDIGDASDLIDQALAIDSASEAALELRKEMLALRRERERERERVRAVRAAVDRAKTSLDEEDFEAAVRHADDALAVDPNDAEALTIRVGASAALDERRRHREHKRRAQQAAADARRQFADGEYDAALQLLKGFSPEHDLVSETLTELQKEFETIRGRRQRVDELMARATQALESGKFDDVISRAFDISAIEPDRPEVAALIKEAQERKAAAIAARRARHKADAKLAEASTRLAEKDFAGARELVEAARGDDPQHPEIASHLSRIKAAQAEHTALSQRMASIRAAADAARSSLARGELELAVEYSEAALALDPSLGDMQALRDNARATLAEQQATEEHERMAKQTVERARALFESKEYAKALDLLDHFQPPHVLVVEALEELRTQFDAIEGRRRQEEAEAAARREEAEREAAERRRTETMRQLLAGARTLSDQEDFAGAIRMADDALRMEPQSIEARDLRAAAVAGLQEQSARKERERLAREAEERARIEAEKAAAARRLAEAREREEKERLAREAAERARAEAERAAEERRREAAARERELAEANRKKAAADLAVRIERLTADAQSALEAKAFKAARLHAETILALEPDHEIARSVLASARQGQSEQFTRRVRKLAPAAAVVLVTAVAVWYYSQTPPPTSSPTANPGSVPPSSTQSAPGTLVQPSAGKPSSPPTSSAPVAQPTVTDGRPTGPGTAAVPESSTPATPVAPDSSARDEARERQLESSRRTARNHMQSGRRAQALSSALAGLKEAPDDSALLSIIDALLSDAQNATERAKSQAVNANARTLSSGTFSEGVKLEEEAKRLAGENKKDAATRTHWRAAERFEVSARQAADAALENEQARLKQQETDRARQLKEAADEKARGKTTEEPSRQKPSGEQQAGQKASGDQTPPPQGGRGTVPVPREESKVADGRTASGTDRATAPAPKPALTRAEEEERVKATLKRYEEAHDGLNAPAVKAVYPGAPDLTKAFASYEFYRLEMVCRDLKLSTDLTTATVQCLMIHNFKAKGPFPPRNERRTEEFTLQKQGDRWLITQIDRRS